MAIGIGIEVGSAVVRGVVLERAGAQLKCLAARELAYDPSSADASTQALIQLRRMLRIARPVVVGLPSSAAILATVQPLIPNPRRSLLAVQFELQQQLPFDLPDAVWHYQWLSNGAGGGGSASAAHEMLLLRRTTQGLPEKPVIVRRIPDTQASGREAIVAAVKRSILEERLACCRRAGLTVRTVSITSVALLNAWHAQHGGTIPRPAALLHVANEHAGEWIMMTNRTIHVVPVVSPSADSFCADLCGAWQAFASQLAAEAEGQEGTLPRAVWMVGDSSAFLQLKDRLSSTLAVDVEQFDMATGPLILDHPERLAAAVGLAFQALGLVRIPLNLLAAAQADVHGRRVRQAAACASALCALAAIGLGLSGAMELRQRRALVLQALERREQLYQSLRPEVRALLQRQEQVEQRSRQLEQLAGERTLVSQWLGQVAEALPDNVWLTKLECAKNGIVEGLLEGRAHSFQDVTQFFERLKSLAGMTTVKPLSTTVTQDQETQKDVIVFSVQVQRPLRPDEPKASTETPS